VDVEPLLRLLKPDAETDPAKTYELDSCSLCTDAKSPPRPISSSTPLLLLLLLLADDTAEAVSAMRTMARLEGVEDDESRVMFSAERLLDVVAKEGSRLFRDSAVDRQARRFRKPSEEPEEEENADGTLFATVTAFHADRAGY
jgi:hypothetical protein